MNCGARVCPEMFLVGGWVLPELQQICGVQFGSGTNPGGHVTVSFGATTTTRATVFALLLRVGIASTHLENVSIVTRQ